MAGKIINELRKHYILRDNDLLLTRVLCAPSKMPRVALLSGAPGTGKTYYAECLAKALGARYIFYQLHAWVTTEELIRTPNIASFAAKANGNEPTWIKGVLWNVVEATQQGKVVLCLDEIDKAYERTEYALLEFLDTARFTLPSGEIMQAVASNLYVIITTNETRELHEATLRRCYRHKMEFLPPTKEAALVVRLSGASTEIAQALVNYATLIRNGKLSSPSTKEIVQCASELRWCTSERDVYYLLRARVHKGENVNPDSVESVARRLFELQRQSQNKKGGER